MKILKQTIRSCVAAMLGLGVVTIHAATYQWNGTVSTDWTNTANWASSTMAVTNGTYTGARLNVYNGSKSTCTYTAAEGNTVYQNLGSGTRALVIGSAVNGSMVINGGSWESQGTSPDVIGNISGFVGSLTISGGTYINTNMSGSGQLSVDLGGASGTLNLNSGLAVVRKIVFGETANTTGSGTVNLNGGTLVISNMNRGSINGALYSTNNFNGGTLQALGAGTIIGTMNAVNVLAGGAIVDSHGYNITIQPALLNAVAGLDGGLSKNGSGTLTLNGVNTYTGPTIVNGGTLSECLPTSSVGLTLASGVGLTVLTTNSAWAMNMATMTNATLGLNYGSWGLNSYNNAVFNITNLVARGTITINVSGSSFPVTNMTLLSYGTKSGGGSFILGSLPNGAVGTLTDTGSALILTVTTPSVQGLTWGALVDNVWQTNGAADWYPNSSTYLEYPWGTGDQVTFDDTLSSGGSVNISGAVKPVSITINGSTSSYSFVGSGSIVGASVMNLIGANSLSIYTSNSFTGPIILNGSGSILYVANPNALGATNGSVTVQAGNTLEVGDGFSSGIAVSGKNISIGGAGQGGGLGALRGAVVTGGDNVWGGQVILSGNDASIGAANYGGNLNVSGKITDNGAGYELLVQPGISGTVTISGSGAYGSTVITTGVGSGGGVQLGANNALSTNLLKIAGGYWNLNGFNQTVGGIADYTTNSGAIYNNNSGNPSTLSINFNAGTNSTITPIQNGGGLLSVVKGGSGLQKFGAASSYTGSTTISGGELDVVLPMSSTALTLANGTVIGVTVTNSSWSSMTAMNTTNATISLNFGAGTVGAIFNIGTLNISGSNVINIAATSVPVGQTTLLNYTTKSGGGTFNLGVLPANVQGVITDTGTAIVLNVSFSPQALTWSGAATGSWNTNKTLDWNGGAAYYKDYTNGLGDLVTFDDTASVFAVNVANNVHPLSVTVNNNLNTFTIGGIGQIGGTNSLVKNGANVLSLTSSNAYSGGTTINAGTVSFASGALSDSGNIVVLGTTNSSLQWASGNYQDISGRLVISGNNSDAASAAFVTLDVGTNTVIFHSGINRGDINGDIISNVVQKVGSGRLTLAGGTSTFGTVVRVNNGTLEVATNATLNVNGGVSQSVGALAVDNSTLLVNGGAINLADRLAVATQTNFTSVVTINSGSLTTDGGSSLSDRGIRLAGGVSGGTTNNSATLNLNGGTFTTACLYQGAGGSNTSIVNCNGGMLQASVNPVNGNFMTGLTHAFVKAGGAVIDTVNNNITIGQKFENDGVSVTDGGLIKLGTGQLNLTSANTYTGDTVVSNGVLWVSGSIGTNTVTVCNGATLGSTGIISGPVTIKSGGLLVPGTGSIAAEFLTINNSLQLAGTAILQIGKSGVTIFNDSVTGVGNITYGGTLIVTNASGSTFASGDTFQLFSAGGSKTGNFSSVQMIPTVSGLAAGFNPTSGLLTISSVSTNPPILTNNIVGSNIQFTWGGSGKLQVQTNSLSVGLNTNWVDYPGGATSPVSVPIDKTHGAIFFRIQQ